MPADDPSTMRRLSPIGESNRKNHHRLFLLTRLGCRGVVRPPALLNREGVSICRLKSEDALRRGVVCLLRRRRHAARPARSRCTTSRTDLEPSFDAARLNLGKRGGFRGTEERPNSSEIANVICYLSTYLGVPPELFIDISAFRLQAGRAVRRRVCLGTISSHGAKEKNSTIDSKFFPT